MMPTGSQIYLQFPLTPERQNGVALLLSLISEMTDVASFTRISELGWR